MKIDLLKDHFIDKHILGSWVRSGTHGLVLNDLSLRDSDTYVYSKMFHVVI